VAASGSRLVFLLALAGAGYIVLQRVQNNQSTLYLVPARDQPRGPSTLQKLAAAIDLGAGAVNLFTDGSFRTPTDQPNFSLQAISGDRIIAAPATSPEPRGTLGQILDRIVTPESTVAKRQEPGVSDDVDTMARTLWGEARNEGSRGMQAVANVIMNRVRSPRWPSTPRAVCLQRAQFSCWWDEQAEAVRTVTGTDQRFQTALSLSRRAVAGALPDITDGSDHYANETTLGGPAWWASALTRTRQIGAHTFYRSKA